MKATWEKIEKNQGVLTVEVEAEKVAVALDKAFKKVVAKVNVPGFRKGKVPRSMFEARFGVESLYQDALDIILPEAYSEAVEETKIEPVDRPEVDVQEMGKGQALKFTAKVTVKPEVTLGEYKGVEVEEKKAEVTEEDITAELNRLQQRHAELVVVEDGPAENGDMTSIDFEGFKDDVAFEGGKGENYSLELGSGSFIPGFEEQVVGMNVGESKDINVTFPEDYHSEELKGQPVIFKVTLNGLKRKNLPALDDEFAKDVSEFETLDEYKEDISKRLLTQKEQALKTEKENAVVEKVIAASEVEVPAVMIENQVSDMLNEFANRLQSQGMNLELYTQFTGQTEETLKNQMRPDAEKRVLGNLVLAAVSKAEGIEASEEELQEELEKMGKTYNRPVEEVRSIFTANGMLDQLQSEIVTRKTVDFLVANSKVTA
ncbi:trigger factor [Gorillibacterium massiliense]|uniref:trigger factor n=1 Tax=Gorillibacterium massiliense TaxID=1280390 RepID=UPI0005942267|nr:trigger factor [Gorillibacterium massiliense]